jgi:hypothetical protein
MFFNDITIVPSSGLNLINGSNGSEKLSIVCAIDLRFEAHLYSLELGKFLVMSSDVRKVELKSTCLVHLIYLYLEQLKLMMQINGK